MAIRLQPCEALEPAKQNNLPFIMERYLNENPNTGGATYDLVHGSGHRNVLNVLTLVDAEFGEVKSPK